jgi:hypothetical protein
MSTLHVSTIQLLRIGHKRHTVISNRDVNIKFQSTTLMTIVIFYHKYQCTSKKFPKVGAATVFNFHNVILP